jgi:diaminopimelate epimerase
MKKINFIKMVAAGNDFIASFYTAKTSRLKKLAQNICDRKYGIGGDGLLILEKTKIADIGMRIFNADGSEAKMCGNGARCVALYIGRKRLQIKTKAGIIESWVRGDNVKIKLTTPTQIKLDMPVEINHRQLKVNFINTGVPHAVIFTEGLDKIEVSNLGRQIRHHKKFVPYGTNVDFVEVLDNDTIKIRTYERGVEDETLACGTGAVASSLITSCKLPARNLKKINVQTRSRETLHVYFDKTKNKFNNVWLEGKARIVGEGVYYV